MMVLGIVIEFIAGYFRYCNEACGRAVGVMMGCGVACEGFTFGQKKGQLVMLVHFEIIMSSQFLLC